MVRTLVSHYARKGSVQRVVAAGTGNQGFHLFELCSRSEEKSIVLLYRRKHLRTSILVKLGSFSSNRIENMALQSRELVTDE